MADAFGLSGGELAAIGASLVWTGSSVAFEAAGRRMGALPLNLVRLVFAWALLAGLAALLRGMPLPLDVPARSWGWLLLSGLFGFVLGDLCLFRAYILVGARLTSLVYCVSPVMTALLAWALLGDALHVRDAAGMLLVVGGVTWAVAARTRRLALEGVGAAASGHVVQGSLLAVLGAFGQAAGLVLSRHGLAGVHPVTGTQVRALAGIVGFTVVITLAGAWPRLAAGLRDRVALSRAGVGALLGPCIGVSLSLYSITHAEPGVAAALMSLSPIFILPVAAWRGERVGVAGVLGALVAVGGVILLVL